MQVSDLNFLTKRLNCINIMSQNCFTMRPQRGKTYVDPVLDHYHAISYMLRIYKGCYKFFQGNYNVIQ